MNWLHCLNQNQVSPMALHHLSPDKWVSEHCLLRVSDWDWFIFILLSATYSMASIHPPILPLILSFLLCLLTQLFILLFPLCTPLFETNTKTAHWSQDNLLHYKHSIYASAHTIRLTEGHRPRPALETPMALLGIVFNWTCPDETDPLLYGILPYITDLK